MKSVVSIFFVLLSISSCSSNSSKKTQLGFSIETPEILHHNQDQLNQVIIYDVFSPPVASRIYAYTSLAFYEAVRFQNSQYQSLTKQLKGFKPTPSPDGSKKYNFNLAATKAFFNVAHKLIFSKDSLANYEDQVFNAFKETMSKEDFARSVEFGDAVAEVIIERSTKDNYKQTRGMARYLGSSEDGKWQPTSPDYLDGMEPYWGKINPLFLDSSTQCAAPPPPVFSASKNSEFYKNAFEVYSISKTLSDSQKLIIKYWDDNPFVMEHSGHMMFANKKITPGGHWMGIAGIACKKSKADIVKTAYTYSLTAVALLESFISCWQTKYQTTVVRPITYIKNIIDNNWEPTLQTPPFPEYPSGHSAISAASATILTALYGDNFSFHDDSDKKYIGMEKDFPSFYAASTEAAVSRVYGGIHYPSGMNGGILQGKQVGNQIVTKIINKSGLNFFKE